MKRKFNSCFLFLLLLAFFVIIPGDSIGQTKVKRYELSKNAEPVPGQPYEKFSTRDRFGREIIFYLSKATASQNPLPLVLFIEGSGCSSRFEGKFPQSGEKSHRFFNNWL